MIRTPRPGLIAPGVLTVLVHAVQPTTAAAQLAITSPLVLSPASPAIGENVTATFTVANRGTTAVTVPYFMVGARTPSGASVDFPASPPVTLRAGDSYQFTANRSFAVSGSHLAWPAYYAGNSQWVELGARRSFPVATPGKVEITSPVTLTPAAPIAGQPVVARFSIRNTGGSPITAGLVVAVRSGTGQNIDFAYSDPQPIPPNQTLAYEQTGVMPAAGQYTIWPAAYTNGWSELATRTTVTVSQPCWPERTGPPTWPCAATRLYAPKSPFNTPLPDAPRAVTNWSAINRRMLYEFPKSTSPAVPVHPDNLATDAPGNFGQPTYYSRDSDPEYVLTCTMTDAWGPCPVEGMKVKIPEGARVEGNVAAKETRNDPGYIEEPDAHLTVVELATGVEFDLWQVHRNPILKADGPQLRVSWGGTARIDGTGLADSGKATAAGFASLAGRIRAEELQAGEIDHGLTIVILCESGQAPVFPARDHGMRCSDRHLNLADDDAPAMGTRFWLDLPLDTINGFPIKAWQKTILRALKRYGAFFGDTGTEGIFSLEIESGNQYTALGAPRAFFHNYVATRYPEFRT